MSSARVRLGLSLQHKLGLSKNSGSPAFEAAHRKYEHLRGFVTALSERLAAYVVTSSAQEAGLALSSCLLSLLTVADEGFRAAVALREAHLQGAYGYANHLREAFVKAVVEPADAWRAEVYDLETHVKSFEEARLRYDHYARKVQELNAKLRAEKKKNGESVATREKLERNTAKLAEVHQSYQAITNDACKRLNRAWDERLQTLQGILARVVLFEEALASHQHMQSLGVSRVLENSTAVKLKEASGIETYLPKAETTHMVGPLVRRGKVIKTRMLFRLVGSSLEMYDLPAGSGNSAAAAAAVATTSSGGGGVASSGIGGGSGAALLQDPREVFEVTGASMAFDTTLRVQCEEGAELLLAAADAAEGEAWVQALGRAATWDRTASHRRVERALKQALEFKEAGRRCDSRTALQLEAEMGVTDAMHAPPPTAALDWAREFEASGAASPVLMLTAPAGGHVRSGSTGNGASSEPATPVPLQGRPSARGRAAAAETPATGAGNTDWRSSPGALSSPMSLSQTAPAAFSLAMGAQQHPSSGELPPRSRESTPTGGGRSLKRVWSGGGKWMMGMRRKQGSSGGSGGSGGGNSPPGAAFSPSAVPGAQQGPAKEEGQLQQQQRQPPQGEERGWANSRGAPRADMLPRRSASARTPSPVRSNSGGTGGTSPVLGRPLDAGNGGGGGSPDLAVVPAFRAQAGRPASGDGSEAAALLLEDEADADAEENSLSLGPIEAPLELAASKSDVQAVFERLCAAQTAPGAALASSAPANCLSWEALAGWEEVEELQSAGALTAGEARAVWEEAMAVSPASKERPGMDLLGFSAFVRLLEEKHFEKELEHAFGVVLVAGPAIEV